MHISPISHARSHIYLFNASNHNYVAVAILFSIWNTWSALILNTNLKYKCTLTGIATAQLWEQRGIIEPHNHSNWDPHYNTDVYTLGKVQGRAAQWVLSDYPLLIIILYAATVSMEIFVVKKFMA